MNIYLAGPMRGIPEFNFPAFFTAGRKLREQGHVVFNPAERDVQKHGFGMALNNLAGDVEQAAKDHGFSLREALAADTNYICLHADTIALLPGWENSAGARAELALSLALGHNVMHLDV